MVATRCHTALSAPARGHACVQRQPCPVAIAPAWGASENWRTPGAQGRLAHWRFRTQRLAAGAHRHPAPQDRRVADHRQPQPPAARIEYLSPTMENRNSVRSPENARLQSGGHAYDRSGQALNPDRDPGDGGRRGIQDRSLGIGRSTTPLQSAWPSSAVAVCSWPRCPAQALRVKNVCPIAPDIARLADRNQHGKSALFRGLAVSVGYYAGVLTGLILARPPL